MLAHYIKKEPSLFILWYILWLYFVLKEVFLGYCNDIIKNLFLPNY